MFRDDELQALVGFVQGGHQVVPVVAEVDLVEGDDGHAGHAEAAPEPLGMPELFRGEQAVAVENAEFYDHFDYISYEFFCF